MTPRTGDGWNPLAGLGIETRDDMVTALCRLLAPLEPYVSPGGARINLSAAGASFDRAAIGLEGFARRLWGAVPAAMGGRDVLDWEQVRDGLSNGCDPEHAEFWGWPGPEDQRLVEMAAIGFALRAVPDRVWLPLPREAQNNVATYLRHAIAQHHSPNNWMFFRLLVAAGLRRAGEDVAEAPVEAYRTAIDALYQGDGWYRDGPGRRVDHYVGFAFHTYALLLHRLAPETDSGDHLARARLFAPQFAAWFDGHGRGLAYGRSMTYRFAMVAFFGAYAMAETAAPVLPWGVLKGIVLRHLRDWANQPIADRDGVLSVGYAYPNPNMAEAYNSACSPYWALKAFLPLALPAQHPFWTATEQPLPVDLPLVQPAPGFLLQRMPDQTAALAAGQEAQVFRHGAEKYAKFAYSTGFPFCVEARDATLATAALDCMLGVQVNGRPWTPRLCCLSAEVHDNAVRSVWQPYPDVTVTTWLVPWQGGHIRSHTITTPFEIDTVEGGFAVARSDGDHDRWQISQGDAKVIGVDTSQIVDLVGLRHARVHGPDPNGSLRHARIWVPQLLHRLGPGTSVLVCWCGSGALDPTLDPASALAHLATIIGGNGVD